MAMGAERRLPGLHEGHPGDLLITVMEFLRGVKREPWKR